MERLLLTVSSFCYLLGFGRTMIALGAGTFRPSRFNFLAIISGFVFQSGFLYLRGEALGRCPITSLFEALMFFSWSIALIYLMVGPTYRLSLMGAFTAPLVFLIQGFALVALDMTPVLSGIQKNSPNAWLEIHASFSLIAYGAFTLGAVAGVMYLLQEHQLKTHRLHSIFFLLPPIHELGLANKRLIALGLGLLTLGLGAGFFIDRPMDWFKVGWSIAAWLIYAVIFLAGFCPRIPQRKIALSSVVAFGLLMITFGLMPFIPEKPKITGADLPLEIALDEAPSCQEPRSSGTIFAML